MLSSLTSREIKISALIPQTVRRNPSNLPIAGLRATGDRRATVVRTVEAVVMSTQSSFSQLEHIFIYHYGLLFLLLGVLVSALQRWRAQGHRQNSEATGCQVQLETFDGSYQVTILRFPRAFKIACDTMASMMEQHCGYSTSTWRSPPVPT